MHLKSNFSLGVRHINTFPFDPKRLNFDLSDQIIVSQNSTSLFSMSFEYFNRFLQLTLLTNNFFIPTRPNNPASCALFPIVLMFGEVCTSDSISTLTLSADKRRLHLILCTINRSIATVIFLLRPRPNKYRCMWSPCIFGLCIVLFHEEAILLRILLGENLHFDDA